LGLPAVREDARGNPALNAAANRIAELAKCPNLSAAVRHLLADQGERSDIDPALSRARAGAPTELKAASGRRVLVISDGPGRAMAVVAPQASPAGGSNSMSPQRAELAASVSHELANALGAIAGWARLAKQGRRVQEALDLIEGSAEAAWSAARRILGDSGTARNRQQESVDLSAFVDEAARLLAPKASARGVQIRVSAEPGLRVRGDRGSAWTIVWNLAANAVEALGHGGTVELRLHRDGANATLQVRDDGPGMDAEQQARAFEPYFTTKATGTGLGLALVKQAVTESGGRIELVSELDQGTCFTVVLPLATARQGQKRSSGVFYAEPIEGRVLVVDDDLGVRELIATALGMRGAEVVAVRRGDEALAQNGPFMVAIVDLLLPDLRGDALLARLRERGLAKVGMLVSGTELPANLTPGGEPNVVVRKPFELEDLFAGLAAALKQRDAGAIRSALG
jgi:signal transduction histidine kinase/CheY-like chemotaxis protein